jgi:hypothetical protein
VANESAERDVRQLWQAQPEVEPRMSSDEIRRKVQAVEGERRRRSVGFAACGAIIIPSWLAIMWWLPDFRILAIIGLGTALWILYNVHRRSTADTAPTALTTHASGDFYRALLERERAFQQGLPLWFMPPVILSTAAIVVTFLRSARFAHTPVFFGVLLWIVSGTGVALVVALRKSRREAERCQRELDALER